MRPCKDWLSVIAVANLERGEAVQIEIIKSCIYAHLLALYYSSTWYTVKFHLLKCSRVSDSQ